MNLFDLVSRDVPVKQTGRKDGGEWHSPCPRCGGKDRFMFWPEAGNFFCRQCEWKGDAITYLRDLRGLSFHEARQALGKEDLPPIRKSPQQAAIDEAKAAFAEWEADNLARITDSYYAAWEEQHMVLNRLVILLRLPLGNADTWEHWQRELDRLQQEEHCLLAELDFFIQPGRLTERVQQWDRELGAA